MTMWYAPARLSNRQALTPEGFLLCQDVVIGRSGTMLYHPSELPAGIEPGRDGIIEVTRDEADAFCPRTMSSFQGKPVTIGHPGEAVTATTWRTHAVGTVQNVRRGEAADADSLLADLLITDASAITAVRSGLRGVSCGYSADYDQTEPGRARQFAVLGNHVALVDEGRCGPRCIIGDEAMPTARRRTVFMDRIRAAFTTRDQAALDEALAEAAADPDDDGKTGHHVEVHVHNNGASGGGGGSDETKDAEGDPPPAPPAPSEPEAPADPLAEIREVVSSIATRMDAMEEAIRALAEGGSDPEPEAEDPPEEEKDPEPDEEKKTEDRRKVTSDAVMRATTLRTANARAEILKPGTALLTLDAALRPAAVTEALCGFRRRVLTEASQDEARRDMIKTLNDGTMPVFSRMTCDAVAVLFTAASERARDSNNTHNRANDYRAPGGRGGPLSNSDLNKRNREFWAKQGRN